MLAFYCTSVSGLAVQVLWNMQQDEALHAWCREKGLYAHQLMAWRETFCAPAEPSAKEGRGAMRELQSQNDSLERQLRRKDKALAEAAALLVLQKKFQALWVDEV